MWMDMLTAAAGGALVGIVGAGAAESMLLILRRRRNARFIDAGELPYKDEVFRPRWRLLGAMGMVLSAAARGIGASQPAAMGAALLLPALLALAGVWFLRR